MPQHTSLLPSKGLALKRIHIVGRKNSGKTTLITELVAQLTTRGCRVGTIKHTHHHHELDTPGKDSHRHREAGAAVVGILSPGMSAMFRPNSHGLGSAERYSEMAALFSDCDLVLVEGDLGTTAPKIEVWRAVVSARPLADEDASIAALVTEDTIEIRVPVWRRSDVSAVADQLLLM